MRFRSATLSTAQLADLPALDLSLDNSLSGTISDNHSYGVMGSYAVVPVPVTFYRRLSAHHLHESLDPPGSGIRRYRRIHARRREQYGLCEARQEPERVLDGRPLCGHPAIHRRDRLLRREAIRLRDAAPMRAARASSAARAAAISTSLPCRSTITSPSASTPMRAPCGRTFRMVSPMAISNTTMIDPTIGVRFSSNRDAHRSRHRGLRVLARPLRRLWCVSVHRLVSRAQYPYTFASDARREAVRR